jgi:hypothetical protein
MGNNTFQPACLSVVAKRIFEPQGEKYEKV